jgi:hypothetical protein
MTPEPKSAEDAAREYVHENGLDSNTDIIMEEAFLAGVAWQKEREAKLVEALEFYENTTRLMLDVRDLENPMYLSKSIMDNGDKARKALKEIE